MIGIGYPFAKHSSVTSLNRDDDISFGSFIHTGLTENLKKKD